MRVSVKKYWNFVWIFINWSLRPFPYPHFPGPFPHWRSNSFIRKYSRLFCLVGYYIAAYPLSLEYSWSKLVPDYLCIHLIGFASTLCRRTYFFGTAISQSSSNNWAIWIVTQDGRSRYYMILLSVWVGENK